MNQLDKLIEIKPEIKPLVTEIKTLYFEKKWHNISKKIQNLFSVSAFSGSVLLEIYKNCIRNFEEKINDLILSKIVISITSRLKEDSSNKVTEFVAEVIKRIEGHKKSVVNGTIVLRIEQGLIEMRKCKKYVLGNDVAKSPLKMHNGEVNYETGFGFSEEIGKGKLEEAKKEIEKKGYVDPFVNCYYYKAKSIFYILTNNFDKYYNNSMLYLSYTHKQREQIAEEERKTEKKEKVPKKKVEDDSEDEVAQFEKSLIFSDVMTGFSVRDEEYWAFNIGIAALIAESIYNFGELLANPVIKALENSKSNSWLYLLLIAYNHGDIFAYQKVQKQYSNEMNQIQVLKKNKNFLEKKIQLMAILELVFSKEAGQRHIPFTEIAKTARCKPETVEFVVLKALSLGLIKGVIDQVKESVFVYWVCPRVLNRDQIASLGTKIENWMKKVKETQINLE